MSHTATFESPRALTGRSMATSVVVHALLLMWLVLFRPAAAHHEDLTEIAWVDEEPGATPVPQAIAPDPGIARPALALRRAAPASQPGDLPAPDVALSAKLNERLTSLQSAPAAVGSPMPAMPSPGGGAPARLAEGPGMGGGAPIALRKGGGTGAPALELTRSPGGATGAAPAMISDRIPERAAAAAPATAGDASARRTIAGASLMGPVADRAILSRPTPVYPEWAKSEGVEGSVTLYFVVRSDGSVKENVLVQKTAGFEDFDESARTALRAWRFEALHGGAVGEQWGTITFHFRLRDAG